MHDVKLNRGAHGSPFPIASKQFTYHSRIVDLSVFSEVYELYERGWGRLGNS